MSKSPHLILRFLALIFIGITIGHVPLRAGDFTESTKRYTSQGRDITALSYTPSEGKKTHRPIFVLYGSQGDLEDAQTHIITHYYCRLLASQGYQVYALHYLGYFQGKLPEDKANRTRRIEAENLAEIEETVRDGIHQLTAPHEPVAMLGFSFGATLSLDMAGTQPDIAAVVDFYGKAYPWIKNRPVIYQAPTLILHGDADTEAPIANAHELRAFFEEHHIVSDIHIYPGVGHTFNGNPKAAVSLDAQKRTLDFLAKYYPVMP